LQLAEFQIKYRFGNVNEILNDEVCSIKWLDFLEENETLYEKLPIEELTKSIKEEKWYLKNIYLMECDKVEIIAIE
jgi:hypothetical protein